MKYQIACYLPNPMPSTLFCLELLLAVQTLSAVFLPHLSICKYAMLLYYKAKDFAADKLNKKVTKGNEVGFFFIFSSSPLTSCLILKMVFKNTQSPRSCTRRSWTIWTIESLIQTR